MFKVVAYCYVDTLYLKKEYHPTTNGNFNNSCSISVILVHILLSEYAIENGLIYHHLACLMYVPYFGKL